MWRRQHGGQPADRPCLCQRYVASKGNCPSLWELAGGTEGPLSLPPLSQSSYPSGVKLDGVLACPSSGLHHLIPVEAVKKVLLSYLRQQAEDAQAWEDRVVSVACTPHQALRWAMGITDVGYIFSILRPPRCRMGLSWSTVFDMLKRLHSLNSKHMFLCLPLVRMCKLTTSAKYTYVRDRRCF